LVTKAVHAEPSPEGEVEACRLLDSPPFDFPFNRLLCGCQGTNMRVLFFYDSRTA
jgi:hypothetical protein